MKTLIKLTALTVLLAVPALTQGATIVGTPHDLSITGPSATYKGTNTQTCVYCHTPHNALSQLVPLWNHPTTGPSTFTPYTSGTMTAVPGEPAGASLACLSCHDGTIAPNAHGNAPDLTGTKITGKAFLGTDLRNDHPISFLYDASLASTDGGLNAPGSLTVVKLFSGMVECASCHNVHDNDTAKPFLRMPNTSSALCTKCHIK